MNNKYSVGTIHKTNEGYDIEIIENTDFKRRKIKFLDEYGYERVASIGDIFHGKIKNPYHKSVYGIGIKGLNSRMNNKSYMMWHNLIRRTRDDNVIPQYSKSSMCKSWELYDNFLEWYNDTYPKHLEDYKIELDKDLLQQDVENKIYSPETCIWLPKRINLFLHTKTKSNTSGHTGVGFYTEINKYIARGNNFEDSKHISIGRFKEKQDAINAYKEFRRIQAEKAKQYLRDLNYLPEYIIQLIK